MNASDIQERFAQARAAGQRHKEAAASIGISEGAAIAAHTGTHDRPLKATPLRGDWLEILQALEACGPVLALTRNESTVHEKTGVYEKLSATGPVGLALGEAIDLRIFFSQWHAGFGVSEAAANPGTPASLSLQFYNAHGLAVHKVFCRDATDRAAFEAVVQRFADTTLAPTLAPTFVPTFGPKPAAEPVKADADIDTAGLLAGWADMQDTHDFFLLLKKFGAERQQSLRLAEGRFTRRISTSAPRDLLLEAAVDGAPIMVFVGNAGCIQIHSGPVQRIEPLEMRGVPWLNVLDAGFNLHLREDVIDTAWVVEKPTADGIVTSIEAFDRDGELMAMFFGTRKPGQPEREDWRAIVRKMTPLAVAEAA